MSSGATARLLLRSVTPRMAAGSPVLRCDTPDLLPAIGRPSDRPRQRQRHRVFVLLSGADHPAPSHSAGRDHRFEPAISGSGTAKSP
jgi:hypothetical protein